MIVKISGVPPIIASSFAAYTASDGAQVTTITTVADVSGSLNNRYFILPSANNETIYVVWMNINSAGTAPSILNTTNVEIAVATDAADTVIATEMRSVLGALADFAAGGAGADVDLTFATDGRGTLAADSAELPTGFTFTDDTPGTNAVPANILYRIQGKIWTDEVRFDASVSGTLTNIPYSSETIDLIVPIYRIIEIVEN